MNAPATVLVPYSVLSPEELVMLGIPHVAVATFNARSQSYTFVSYSSEEWERKFWEAVSSRSAKAVLEIIEPRAPEWVIKGAIYVAMKMNGETYLALVVPAVILGIDIPLRPNAPPIVDTLKSLGKTIREKIIGCCK